MDSGQATVIGSGPNGLSAAIALAQAGLKVRVVEAAETIGGSARTAELTLPGFRHDVCSAIHPMAACSPFWKTLDLAAHGLEWVHPLPLAHPLDDGPAAILSTSLEETAASLGVDGAAWTRWMAPFVDRWDELAADAMAPLGVPSAPLLMARFGAQALLPATALARMRFDGVPARALFAGLAAHSVLPLERVPSAAIGMMLGIAGHAVGWPFPRGGAQAISDALASLLRSLGGRIEAGVEVRDIGELEDGPVFFCTSPAAMAAIAGDTLPQGYRRRLEAFRHGPGVFKLDWALSEPIPWTDPQVARAGTVHVGGTLEEHAASESACWRGEHSERPFVLVAQHSRFDSSRAPDGQHTGWAYCHVPSGSDRDLTQVIEAQVERFAPGFKDTILARHTFTAQAMQAYNPNYVGGDVNGGAPDIDQLFTRPVARLSPYTTPNPRILLCSASTPPGGGVHGLCGWYAATAWLARWK